MADQDPGARALHRMRSALATLRHDLQLAMEDATPPTIQTIAAVDKALELLGEAEQAVLGAVVSSGVADGGQESAAELEQKGRIFVIDDDSHHADLVARKLRRLGFDVEPGKDVAAVAPIVGPHDTLVVDLGLLDDVDDWTAASVKAARSIVMTGAVGAGARQRAEDLGAMAFLVKPIKIDELAGLLQDDGEEAPA